MELVNIASKGDFQMPRATTSAVTTDRGEWTNLGNIQNVTLYDGKSKTTPTDTPTEYNTPGYIFSIPQELLCFCPTREQLQRRMAERDVPYMMTFPA